MTHETSGNPKGQPPCWLTPLARIIAPTVIAVGLTACGGGGGGNDSNDTPRDSENHAPSAIIKDISSPQSITATIPLDGRASTDPDGDVISFQWSILSGPVGHNADITSPSAAQTSLAADLPGDYVIQLIVNDGLVDSNPQTSSITLTNTTPIANAGADRAVDLTPNSPGSAQLNGSNSSDADGHALHFSWQILDAPIGSTAMLSSASDAMPILQNIDVSGTYTVALTVSDGFTASVQDTVIITTNNVAPVAHAGADIGGKLVGDHVTLNGTQSSDFDGDTLTYAWAFTQQIPANSTASLNQSNTSMPNFIIDQKGSYEVELTVTDGDLSSTDRVMVNAGNTAPIANAGDDQLVTVGERVSLSAADSTDVDGDTLSFIWSLLSIPDGSTAGLNNGTSVNADFIPDVSGQYIVQLQVSDGESTDTDNLHISVDSLTNHAPTADPGAPQSFSNPGIQVVLNGSLSSDPDGDALTFNWSFSEAPTGSSAQLLGADTETPYFIADLQGVYVIQLTVSDGELQSESRSVIVTVDQNTPPQAVAGPDQGGLILGSTVNLNAEHSIDPDGDELTYHWSVTNAPADAQYSFSSDTSATPSLALNRPGSYLIQLTVSDGQFDDIDTLQITLSDGDLDGDGLLSSYELEHGLDPDNIDSDGDSIQDGQENEDGDSLSNYWEQVLGYDINKHDSDDDGTDDGQEDFDNDGFSNQTEIDAGTDPANAASFPIATTDQFSFEVQSSQVTPGGHLVYLVTVANLSDVDILGNVVVDMHIPAGVSFNRIGNASINSTGHTGCSSVGYCDGGDISSWNLGDLNSGDSLSFEVDATVAESVTPGSILSTTLNITSDSVSESIELVRHAEVVAAQPMAFTITPSTEPVAPGGIFDYTLAIGNTSDDMIRDITVALELPANVNIHAPSHSGTVNGNIVTWAIPDLLPTQSLQRSLPISLPTPMQEAATLLTSATLSYAGRPVQTLNDTITVSEPLHLQLDYQTQQSVVAAGESLIYSINISNTSAVNTVSNPVVMLRVPSGVTFNRIANATLDSSAHSGCTSVGMCNGSDEVFWQLPNLTPGDSISFQVNATVSELVRPGAVLQTPIFVSADGLGDVIQQQRSVRVVAQQETSFGLYSSSDALALGESFEYLLYYGNASDDVHENAILTMTVPPSIIIDRIDDGGIVDGDTITWTVPRLLPTASLQRSISATVAINAKPGETLTAFADLSHDAGLELNQSLASSVTVSEPIALQADFHLAKAVVTPNGELKYHLSVSNTSLGRTVENVVLQMRVPNGVLFNRVANASVNSTGHSGCTSVGYCDAGDEVFWNLGNLAAGDSVTLEINATIANATPPGTVITTPVFIQADGLGDILHLQDSASVVAEQAASFYLQASAEPVAPGQHFQYHFEMGNPTDDVLDNIHVELELPAELTVIDAGTGVVTGKRVSWTQTSLLPTHSIHRSITVAVAADAQAGSILKAKATLQIDDGLERDQIVEQSVTVSAPLRLNVDYHLDRTVVAAGNDFTYHITLGNTSLGGRVSNAILMMQVPEGVSFNRITQVAPDSTGHSGCTSVGQCAEDDEVFWNVGDLEAGESITIEINGTVDNTIPPGTVIETPIYVSADALGDTIHLQRSLQVVASEPVGFTLSSTTGTAVAGGAFQYTLSLGNAGNDALDNIAMEISLPEGLAVDAISDGGTQVGNQVRWTVSRLDAAAFLQRSLTVTLASDARSGSILTAHAKLMHDDGMELDQALNTSITVSEPTRLNVDYEVSSSAVNPGDSVVYSITLENTSPGGLIENPQLMMRVPAGITFNRIRDTNPVSTGHSGCTSVGYCGANDEVFWNLDTIQAGTQVRVDITATVDATVTPGSILSAPIMITADGIETNITQRQEVIVTQP